MKDIKGYEELYAVTSCGKVWSYRSKKFLKPSKSKDGYLRVALRKDNKYKNFYIQRLVAEAYLVKPNESYEVNHKDQNRENNCINNLEWISHKDNINYSDRNERVAKSKYKKVLCVETGIVYESLKSAALATGTKDSNISRVCHGRRKTTGGYHWEYVEVN